MNSCVLCTSMPCCPEHCCNWDDCTCEDCDSCVKREEVQPKTQEQPPDDSVRVILLNRKTENQEMPISSLSALNKDEKEEKTNTMAAGGSVFGIRYLRKSKK